MKGPKVTLEQWRALQTVVDQDGFAQAAQHLHRSQSSISYTIAKLQQQLGVQLLQIEGRKAKLTAAGDVLLRRSRALLADAAELEALAHNLEQGWEPEVRLVVDAAFPSGYLMQALKEFVPLSRGSRVQLNEVVLSGADEALLERRADLVIGAQVPQGYLGDPLLEVEFIAVAHHQHRLHRLNRELTHEDLRRELQVVIRDSGLYIKRDTGWLGAEYRWSVTSIDKAVEALLTELGFAWVPVHEVQDYLEQGQLKPLPLREGRHRFVTLYLIPGHPERIGPATSKLADIFRRTCAHE
ncbi:LysR family transcriptional regulator [Candidatus Tenderia electrophaga]|jgi:DNA-binding transcriptional LysR family regulator|uniref:LysR family transcriptional regulator n=1 Tax=Candidatus Tenderia electrophaga TaxID=1748243 RepID=A0A0S2TH52_9GAMM|nr:LysR family transcriptional regulator [Candidatus Tenderia electrophaga]